MGHIGFCSFGSEGWHTCPSTWRPCAPKVLWLNYWELEPSSIVVLMWCKVLWSVAATRSGDMWIYESLFWEMILGLRVQHWMFGCTKRLMAWMFINFFMFVSGTRQMPSNVFLRYIQVWRWGPLSHVSFPGCDGSFENTSPKSRQAYSVHVVKTVGCSYPETNWWVLSPAFGHHLNSIVLIYLFIINYLESSLLIHSDIWNSKIPKWPAILGGMLSSRYRNAWKI